MTLEEKQSEYDLMQNSEKGLIRITIPGGPSLVLNNAWDYTTNLTKTTVKVNGMIKETHPLLKVEKIDLTPISSHDVFMVSVLRQPESELKHGKSR